MRRALMAYGAAADASHLQRVSSIARSTHNGGNVMQRNVSMKLRSLESSVGPPYGGGAPSGGGGQYFERRGSIDGILPGLMGSGLFAASGAAGGGSGRRTSLQLAAGRAPSQEGAAAAAQSSGSGRSMALGMSTGGGKQLPEPSAAALPQRAAYSAGARHTCIAGCSLFAIALCRAPFAQKASSKHPTSHKSCVSLLPSHRQPIHATHPNAPQLCLYPTRTRPRTRRSWNGSTPAPTLRGGGC